MKLSPFLFLVILFFFILPVNAVTISIEQPAGLSFYVAPSNVNYNPSDVAICNDLYNISVYNADYSYTSGQLIYVGQRSTYLIDCVFSEQYIYLSHADGSIYRIPNRDGIIYWSSLKDTEKQLLITVGTYPKMTIGNDGNLYIASGSGIHKIDLESLTVTTGSDIGQHTSVNFDKNYMYNGVSYVVGVTNNDFSYLKFNTLTDYKQVIYNTTTNYGSGTRSIMAFIPLTNGKYFTYVFSSTNQAAAYTGSYHSADTVISAVNSEVSALYNDAIVTSDGIAIISSFGDDKVDTYFIGAGAYNFGAVGDSTTPPEITYNAKSVNAEYETYYNQTNVNFMWSLAIDDDFIDTYNSVYSDPIYNRYYWRIELFSPDNIFINSYIIPTNWKYQSYTLGIFGAGDYINSGNVQFNNIVGNGTYTVKIYELNRITGAKAFLDSDTFEILAQTNPSSSSGISEASGESAAYNFLNSPYLVAIIIIGVVGFQFGRGRDGNINGSAMIVLIPLAVGLCALMGILPMWILYVMVLCIIAFVAIKMSSGGT